MKLPIRRTSLYPQLEGLSREQVLDVQLRKLQYQLEYVYTNSLFYRRLFDQAKVKPGDIKTRDDLRRLPMITKADLLKDQQEKPPYGHRLCVPEEKVVHTLLTSGTSGLGQELYGETRCDCEYWGSAWAQWYYSMGLRKGDRIMHTWPLGNNAGPQSALWGCHKLGANTFPIAIHDSKAKLQSYILKFQPHGILVTPSYLTHLTVLAREMGVEPRRDLPELKTIFMATEATPVNWAVQMEEFWDCRLHEMYGSTQVATWGAGSCEKGMAPGGQRGCLHLGETMTLFEVLDRETGEPVSSGEEGELIVTNLNREGSPLIRFRTDDRVTFISYRDCDCGRPFDALQAGTIARYDDMIKMKVTNVWPEAVDALVFAYAEIDEYNGRVVVDDRGREEILLSVEFKNQPLDAALKTQILAQLGEDIRRRIGVSMSIGEVPAGSLERFIFKTRRWTDERRKGLERIKYTLGGTKQEVGG